MSGPITPWEVAALSQERLRELRVEAALHRLRSTRLEARPTTRTLTPKWLVQLLAPERAAPACCPQAA